MIWTQDGPNLFRSLGTFGPIAVVVKVANEWHAKKRTADGHERRAQFPSKEAAQEWCADASPALPGE